MPNIKLELDEFGAGGKISILITMTDKLNIARSEKEKLRMIKQVLKETKKLLKEILKEE